MRSTADLSAWPWEDISEENIFSLFKGLSLLFLPYLHKAKVRLVLKKKHLISSRRLSAKGMGCKSPLFPCAAVGFMFWAEEINLLPTHNREHL